LDIINHAHMIITHKPRASWHLQGGSEGVPKVGGAKTFCVHKSRNFLMQADSQVYQDLRKPSLMIFSPTVGVPGGSESWWRHKTGLKMDIVIKSKVLGIFRKFFLRSMSVHLNITFFEKNYQNSKIRDLENFW